MRSRVGNGILFRKRGIISEWLPLFRGRKCSFRCIPRFTEKSIPRLGTEENKMNRIEYCRQHVFVRDMLRNGIPRACFYFFSLPNGISRVFCSAEWFRTKFREFASVFVPWYRMPSILLLCGTVWNSESFIFRGTAGIPRNNFFVGNCQP